MIRELVRRAISSYRFVSKRRSSENSTEVVAHASHWVSVFFERASTRPESN
jgi:cation transport regulator ChaB